MTIDEIFEKKKEIDSMLSQLNPNVSTGIVVYMMYNNYKMSRNCKDINSFKNFIKDFYNEYNNVSKYIEPAIYKHDFILHTDYMHADKYIEKIVEQPTSYSFYMSIFIHTTQKG